MPVVALENWRGRSNLALWVGAAGCSEGLVCAVPALPSAPTVPTTVHKSVAETAEVR
jgi:hypothetical protein